MSAASPNIEALQNVKPADGEALLWACDQRDPRTLGPGLLNDARNLRYTDGLPTTRKGVVKPAWANLTNAGDYIIRPLGTPYGRGVFKDPNGVEWQIVAAGGFVYRTRPYNANVTIPLPAGVRILSACNFVQAFNRLFLFRGRYLAPLVLSDLTTGFQDLLPGYDYSTVYNAVINATGQAAEEMAYGPYLAVSSITWAEGIATVTTSAQHGYVTGSDVTIRGANEAWFNGRWSVTVVDDVTFTYALANGAAASATGTITCSNNAYYWRALGSQVTLANLARAVNTTFQLTSLTSAAQFTLTSVNSGRTFTISSLTRVSTTATAISQNHGLVTGQSVTVSGATHPNFNGTWVITVVDANTFTYTFAGASGNETSPCSGSATYSLYATATKANHGLTTGMTVTVAGATPSAYNGTFQVTVVSSSTFTYVMAGSPNASGNATGTITVTPSTSTTAVATKAGHGLSTGDTVTVSGATPSAYNGTYAIMVINASVFTYTFAGGTSPATGTIIVTSFGGTGATATAPNHGFATGDYVTISGASPAIYNGTFPVSVLSANTFSYTLMADPGADATGVITAQTSRVLAGQTPDSHPEAWARAYNILPNAETALFTNDLLLVPTAFEPSSVDNYSTFNGGTYKKVDYLVATNFADYIHFSFINEFRINAGSADEIVDLFKFGEGTVVVLKDKSWAVLGNVTGALTAVTLDVRDTEFGCCGPRAWTVVGSNAYYLSPRYGVVTIRQTDLSKMLSVNVPLSAPIQPTIDLLDWTQARAFRMTHWDNKLYVSVIHQIRGPMVLVYDFKASVRLGNNVWESGVMSQGWCPLDTGTALKVREFFRMNFNGEERCFFVSTDGWVNLMEESDFGDQVADAGGLQGLGWEEIESYALTRAYNPTLQSLNRAVELAYSLATVRPCYSINVVYAGVNNRAAVCNNVTRSRTAYDRPFDAAPWDPSNVNNDFETPGRQDYSVLLTPNLIAAATQYVGVPFSFGSTIYIYQVTNLVVGQKYYFLPGNNDQFLANGFDQVLRGPFIAASTVVVYGVGPGTVTATIGISPGIYLGSGVILNQFQESLDTRRIGWRQGKSYQLEFINTQGRIKIIGQRVTSIGTRDQKGVQQ